MSLSLGRAGAPVTVVMATEAYKQQSLPEWWREHGVALYECPDLVREGERMPLQLQCYWQLTLDLSISVIKEIKIAQWLLREEGGGERGGCCSGPPIKIKQAEMIHWQYSVLSY